MKMYLVRRITDELPSGECGIVDHYYAVGLFSSKVLAIKAKEQAEVIPSEFETEIDIIEFDVNKVYPVENQPYIGGGFYIE